MRQVLFAFISVVMITFRGVASAQPWKSVDPSSPSCSIEQLKAAQAYAASLKPTAVTN